ncbi:MAG: hypothetical protein V1859_08005 [archaeon]
MKRLAQTDKINILDTKVASLEKRNIELTNHILGLSKRLGEVQKLNEESKSLIIAQDEAEEKIGTNVDALRSIIDSKKERLEELEKKIEDRLSKSREDTLKTDAIANDILTKDSLYSESELDKTRKIRELESKIEERLGVKKELEEQNNNPAEKFGDARKERIIELEKKIRVKLEGKKIEPLKEKIAGLKDLYYTLSKAKGIKKEKLLMLKGKIEKLEKKLAKVKV